MLKISYKTISEVLMKLINCFKSINVGIAKSESENNSNSELVEALMLTGANITENGFIDLAKENAKQVFIEYNIFNKQKLKLGQIVFLSKGTNLRAAVISEEQEKLNLVAPASCLVIDLDINKILPEFLTLFLNSEYGQSLLDSLSKGSMIQNISVSSLKSIEINVPELSKQKVISEVFYQHTQALMILEKMKKKHLTVMEATLQKLMA